MKKIMFNDFYGLTDAVLQGRKTMTRRLVPDSILNMVGEYQREYYEATLEQISERGAILNMITGERMLRTAYRVDEVVAVAQAYKDAGIDPHFLMFQPVKGSTYFAEMEIEAMFTGGWNNKMFVRAELMPHQIQITDIKVERLQDISSEDCLREGVYCDNIPQYLCDGYESIQKAYFAEGIDDTFKCPIDAFAALIDKVSGKGTWESNPFVFAYEFELVK